MRILSVVGTRPNFMKLAPVDCELAKRPDLEHVVVHTGQLADPAMSVALFEQLWIPAPDHHLGVAAGSDLEQAARVMLRLEPILTELHPDLVLVYGDANSTVAAALTAAKLGLRVGHVEAGLRSGDWSLPEEINRVVTDRVSDLLFAPSRDAVANLGSEGIPAERVHFVGNVMIDTLCWALPHAQDLNAPARHGVAGAPYCVVTLHRPTNVDEPEALLELSLALARLADEMVVVFPVHPRTRERLSALGMRPENGSGLRLLEPLGYVEMLSLVAGAELVITDSGGLQEETTFLGVPCLTVRANTERSITCLHGTNRLVAPRSDAVLAAAARARQRRSPARPVIERWDGRAAERIARVLCEGVGYDADDAEPGEAVAARRARRAVAVPQLSIVG